jgi:hypothetical protein
MSQYTGVRIQHIPQYGTTGITDINKLREIFYDVLESVLGDANVADARVFRL